MIFIFNFLQITRYVHIVLISVAFVKKWKSSTLEKVTFGRFLVNLVRVILWWTCHNYIFIPYILHTVLQGIMYLCNCYRSRRDRSIASFNNFVDSQSESIYACLFMYFCKQISGRIDQDITSKLGYYMQLLTICWLIKNV